jgi:hypothetical protein
MRYFRQSEEPTREQLAQISSEVRTLAIPNDAVYITVEDDDEELPNWLQAAEVLNVPGEPARCRNCGALI